MPNLRLHRDEDHDTRSSLPFPNHYRDESQPRIGRIGAGYHTLPESPFRIDSIRNVEQALEAVERNFASLRHAFGDDTDDRPRAA